ncbi:hypothetical protein [Nocardioides antri]|uniref:Lipoprotein n=1 Tax=Nocardioides antri TaxID=2607659 RepID=A0A5B1M473_9ACTN|nr:hypothetical protein [Nocardioides antri]KAA1427551.1 hypothetical protein F0U47_08820 [Nocardioides antri]
MLARIALASILVVLTPSLAACGDEAAEIADGDVVRARADDQFTSGRRTTITLPIGQLLVRAPKPVDEAAADETRSREAVSAPSGSVLVPITWQWDTWGSDRLGGIVDTRDTPHVDLVTEDGRYRLPPPDQDAVGGESFYVVVAGKAEERSLEIDFDGETQTLDLVTGDREEGRAAALYDIDEERLRKKDCSKETWFESRTVSAEFSCALIGPVLTPYAAGEWAPDGSLWLAVTLSTEMRIYGETNLFGTGARYLATDVKVRPEIDGERPDLELSTEDDADVCPIRSKYTCGWSKHLLFEVPEDDPEQGPLDLEVTYRLVLNNSWGNWDPPRRQRASAEETLKIWMD